MKAFLLAAGRGTRISRMVEEVPKCTLPIAGVPLIRRTVEMLQDYGFEVIVCVGYRAKDIYKALEGFKVTYYHNPFFEVTNSIASLWFAKDALEGDVLIANADVYFEREVLDIVLRDSHQVVMAIDKNRTEVGDYFFATTANGSIEKFGKELPIHVRSCEYVGMAKISGKFISQFKDRLNDLVLRTQYNKWWENVLYSFTDTKEHEIFTVDVGAHFWAEVDYFDDYERILRYVEKSGVNYVQ